MTILTKNNACKDGRMWADSQTDYKTAWETCERADWLLWAAKKFNVDLKKLTLAKVACARTVQHLMKDKRSLDTLDVAERFGNGLATAEELRKAADAAYAAAYAADADAAYAAYAADAAADAADAAADAADAAADAADAAAYYADTHALKEMSDLVRAHISFDDLEIK